MPFIPIDDSPYDRDAKLKRTIEWLKTRNVVPERPVVRSDIILSPRKKRGSCRVCGQQIANPDGVCRTCYDKERAAHKKVRVYPEGKRPCPHCGEREVSFKVSMCYQCRVKRGTGRKKKSLTQSS
jgi:hypothetical protein